MDAASLAGRLLLQPCEFCLTGWTSFPSEDTILFHRDDPETDKTCPGKLVKKDRVLSLIEKPFVPKSTETDKPDAGIPWSDWDFRGERWCVPVHNFLVAKGISSPTVIANLKSKGGKFFYGGELIEGAYFNKADSPLKPDNCTWAPAQELLELISISSAKGLGH